jgi:signal peptidase I
LVDGLQYGSNIMPETPLTNQPPVTKTPPEPLADHRAAISSAQNKNQNEGFKNVIYTILLFIFAPLFALVMIMFVFQSYVVDGSSMEPNLQNGNRVFILKLPKTIESIRGKQYIPKRYEVIVFKKPSDPSVQLIKRVIGLPGDHVVVKNNQITIYNTDNPNGFNPDSSTSYGADLSPTSGNADITVGAGELFVCGDNRSPGGSLDSRNNLGLVPVENIIGRLWIRYYPFGGFKWFSALKYALQF